MTSTHLNKLKNKTLLITAIMIVVLLISGVYAYRYMTKQNSLINTNKDVNKEIDQTLAKVGKLIVLPDNERPQVAVISDINKLKEQSFFNNAQNGDKVIMYLKVKKAIIYRPSLNKLIEVGPINIADQTTPAADQGDLPTFTVPNKAK